MPPKLLFTPGPLNTSESVKRAMLHDMGSRDREFLDLVRSIRTELLALGGVSQQAGFEAILLQGSGTYGVESVLSSVIPASGRLLLLVNGAYGERLVQIAQRHNISHDVLRWPENQPVNPGIVSNKLTEQPAFTHVAAVHCETSTGILNDVDAIGGEVHLSGAAFIVDAMSSFGALPLDLAKDQIDFVISSANKCLQGVPGFSFVLARRALLEQSKSSARSLSLDLYEQWRGLETSGQFRFTPPTHALLAFDQALRELKDEGGIPARFRRYEANHHLLVAGMRRLGFVPYLDPKIQSVIITAFLYPNHPQWKFDDFYQRLSQRGMVIYPGKLSTLECFRLGNIGHLFPKDIEALLQSIEAVLSEMQIPLPVSAL